MLILIIILFGYVGMKYYSFICYIIFVIIFNYYYYIYYYYMQNIVYDIDIINDCIIAIILYYGLI